MCYDISFKIHIAELSDYFPDLVFDEQIDIEFGTFDHRQGPALFAKHPIIYEPKNDDKLHIRLMEWGLIRHHETQVPSAADQTFMLNCRSEKILTEPKGYWYKIRNKRCLIPVSGIFEHREIKGWKKKVPYFVRPRDQTIFFLPGLYSVAQIEDRETGEVSEKWTFTMLTRTATKGFSNIHNGKTNPGRMPLFMPFPIAEEYVRKDLSENRYREILDYQMPFEELIYHPVYTIRTPKMRPDDKDKTEFYDWENLPALGELNPD